MQPADYITIPLCRYHLPFLLYSYLYISSEDEIITKLKNLQYQQQLRLILTVHQNVDSDKHTSTCLIIKGTTHQC